MTLILGMSKPEGIYVCVDYRITDLRTKRILSDTANKCLTIHYPPLENGVKGLLAFTGTATYSDGTPTMTWIRETLRGEAEVPDQSMAHLRARLDRDFAPLRRPLIINFLGLHGTKRFFGGLSNVSSSGILPSFGYVMSEVDASFLFTNGQGAIKAIADDKLARMRSLLGVRPRKVMDHMKLLAIVNRRVASSDPTVSPFCKVSFINADDKNSPASHAFVEHGETIPFEMPLLLGGIDLTYLTDQIQRMRSGEGSLDTDVINQHLQRRP